MLLRTFLHFCSVVLLLPNFAAARPVADIPFLQDVAVRFTMNQELDGATFRKVGVNRDGIIYVLTDRGVARVFEDKLALDRSFRPLTGLKTHDLTMQGGELLYLYEDRFLANGWAGKVKEHLPAGRFQSSRSSTRTLAKLWLSTKRLMTSITLGSS